MRAAGKRALIVARTSFFAAASLPVTRPIRRGRNGSGRFRSEDAFRRELLLQALERGEVISEPEPLDRQRAHAEIAACLEQLRPPENVDTLTVRKIQPQRIEAAARHRHAEARAVVRILQREED